jgi:ankyrin repeat protein
MRRWLRPRAQEDMERRIAMLKERLKNGHASHERAVLQRSRSATSTGTLQKFKTEGTPGTFLDIGALFNQIEPPELKQKRLRRMSSDWSTDSSTQGFKSVLDCYSAEFRRAVKDVQRDYDAGSVDTDEEPDITINDPVDDFISEAVVSTIFEEYPPMPSSFLRADEYRQRDDTCIEGIDAHDRGICLCSISEDRLEEFWALPHGLSARGQQIIETGKISESDISFRDRFGNSVLHFIAARAPKETLFIALKAGADVSVTNSGRQTFLHALSPSWFSNLESAKSSLRVLFNTLLSTPVDIYARDAYGRNLFHYLKRYVNDTIVLRQIAADYDLHRIYLRDAFGIIPIERPDMQLLGAENNDYISLEIDQLDTLPSTEQVISDPRYLLSQARLLKIVSLAYTNPMAESNKGQNGLHCLAEVYLSPEYVSKTRLDYLHSLVDAGVSANAYDGKGDTVLMAFVKEIPENAVFKDVMEILGTLILRGGADINARNRRGETALHIAVKNDRKLVLTTISLIQNGANVHARDWNGRGVLGILTERLMTWTRLRAVQQYARSEACFALLSGNGAILAPTSLNEWGEQGLENITVNKVRKDIGSFPLGMSKRVPHKATPYPICDQEDEDYRTKMPGESNLVPFLNKLEYSVPENM